MFGLVLITVGVIIWLTGARMVSETLKEVRIIVDDCQGIIGQTSTTHNSYTAGCNEFNDRPAMNWDRGSDCEMRMPNATAEATTLAPAPGPRSIPNNEEAAANAIGQRNRASLVSSFFSGTGRSYDRVAKLFTFGLDNYWKNEIVRLVPPSRRILDLGCGTGILTEHMASKVPGSEFVGVDLTPDYLVEYNERLRRKPWIHARSVLGNAETVELEGEFDVVASSYLAKYVDPDLLVSNVTPHLRRGGTFVAHDFTMPTNPLYLALWMAYTQAIHRIGPVLLTEWHEAFASGFELVIKTQWLDTFPEVLREHGYGGIHVRSLSFGTAGLVWATKT